MIRRQPATIATRALRLAWVGVAVAVVAVLIDAVQSGPRPPAGRPTIPQHLPLAHGRRPAASSPVPPRPAVARSFLAAGGILTATVIVRDPGPCAVRLVAADGTTLATGRAAAGALAAPVSLRAQASVGERVTLLLRPTLPGALTWQVTLDGASG